MNININNNINIYNNIIRQNNINYNLYYNNIVYEIINRNQTIKCPLCRKEQDHTTRLISGDFCCPICLDDEEELYVPCAHSTAHVICCSKCYESLKTH